MTSNDRQPIHRSWPLRFEILRRPRRRGTWIALATGLMVVVSVAFDVGGATTTTDRARDLRVYVKLINTDLASCNSSLSDSFDAYQAAVSGQPGKRSTAEAIIAGDEPNCTPASNSDLFDFATSQAPATLRGYGMQTVATNVDTWAFPDAAQAITDLGRMVLRPGDRATVADLRAVTLAMTGLSSSAERTLGAAAGALHTRIDVLDIRAASRLQGGGL